MKIKATSTSFSKHPRLRAALLESFPDAEFNDDGRKYTRAELIDYIKDADGLVLGLESVDDDVLAACPNLKIVSKYGVGLDNLDQQACKDRGIAVGWTGGVNKRSVAEMDLCFMLGLARGLYRTSLDLMDGRWNKDGGFQLSGKTVGVIGLGFREVKSFACYSPLAVVFLATTSLIKAPCVRNLILNT